MVNISEKFLAARMNDTQKAPEQRQNMQRHLRASNQSLTFSAVHFPSYLRTFDRFLQDSSRKLRWRLARLCLGFTQRFSARSASVRSEEHTSELQSLTNLVCRLLL